MNHFRLFLTFVLAIVALVLISPSSLRAAGTATFIVNTTTDSIDKNPGDGVCADKNGKCSLRAAIMETNALGGKNTVTLPAGSYAFKLKGENEDFAKKGDLDIRSNLTLNGASAKKTVIDAMGLDRIFDIQSGKVVISKLTVKNGNVHFDEKIESSGFGGGILVRKTAALTLKKVVARNNMARAIGGVMNLGTLLMLQSSIDSNIASGEYAEGGGVGNTGAMTIDQSNIVNNQVDDTKDLGGSGGILNAQGTMRITRSTIANNKAEFYGGGVRNSGTMNIVNTTIGGNEAKYGGGLMNSVMVTTSLYNVTVVNNRASGGDGSGGGVYASESTLNWKNTLIAGNTNANGIENCTGTVTSQGYNLMTYAGMYCALEGGENVMTDQYGLTESDVKLGPLQKNGGSTMTHALLDGSRAIDMGNPAGCVDNTDTLLTQDQRNSSRPTDGDGMNGARCDVGAFEK